MAIYRGPGGSGDAINDAASEAVITVEARDAALAAQAAAEASATAAASSATSAASSATTAASNVSTALSSGTNSASLTTLTTTGNVGIGTSSPLDKLHVEGNLYLGTSSRTIYTGGTGNLILQNNTGNTIFARANGASESMRLDSSGNLLVGTSTSGASKLVVNDNSIQVNTAKTPASASATGTTGQIAWDSNYVYVCVATNTWKRTALATW